MLKSLELSGFKSFAKRTEMHFPKRISAIVGPNGTGKCVVGSTKVQLRNGQRVSIKKMFKEARKTAQHVEEYDDGVGVLKSDVTYNVASINPKTLKQEWRPVSAFVRKTAPEKNIKITTRSGREVIATPYHPVFTLEKGVMKELKAESLSEGTRIAVSRSLGMKGEVQELSPQSILTSFQQEDHVYLPYSSALVSSIEKKMVAVGEEQKTSFSRSCGLPSDIIQRVYDGQSLNIVHAQKVFPETKADIFSKRILKSKGTGTLRIPRYVDKSVARFLGYFVAEGSCGTNGQVRIINNDPETIKDYISCVKKSFGVEAHVYSYAEKAQDVIVYSETLRRVLDRIFGLTRGTSAKGKKVPPQIFKSPNEIIASFLSALFDGDGHFKVKKKSSSNTYFEYATASEELARGVSNLLLRFGIIPIVRRKEKYASNTKNKTKRVYWSVFVYGTAQLSKLASVLDIKSYKAAALEELKKSKTKTNPNIDLIPDVCELVRDLVKAADIKVKPLRKQYPTLAAYCEKRCEASRGGLKTVLEVVEKYGKTNKEVIKKTEQLRKIAYSDVMWDEIVSLEEIPGDQYVYDLTVEETHNFVANDIYVHNSNTADAFRFALGEQSMKSLRGKRSNDLLWNGSSQVPRANRAGVKVTFDNNKKILDVDFDEVAVERVMHRDSSHQYFLNGSQVRLKDILEMLASANIGPTGHHIISQGEADRILMVKPAERKRIIEDALGLKIYHYKKDESEKKLEKTHDNLQEILGLQREIEPELRSLSRQMSRIDKARRIQKETYKKARLFFASKGHHVQQHYESLDTKERELKERKHTLEEKVSAYTPREDTQSKEVLSNLKEERKEVEKKRQALLKEQRELERTIGRLEGRLMATSSREEEQEGSISFSRLILLKEDILTVLREDNAAERITTLFDACMRGGQKKDSTEKEESIREEIGEKRREEKQLSLREKEYTQALSSLEEKIEKHSSREQRSDEEILDIKDEIRACISGLEDVTKERASLEEEREEIKRDVADLGIILGHGIASYMDLLEQDDFNPLGKEGLRDLRREIERGRIQIEDADLSEAKGVERAYREVKERNDFLEKEIDDLRSTRSSLEGLIRDLEKELNEKFKEGITDINAQFNHFFTMLFGGGSAELAVITEEKQDGSEEEGVTIEVELPQKRIKGLTMLSGGERALTSIALVFSISHINPPPFLILDETDAALDEANSRKYGDMIEALSEQSQLILVTHNRETMSRAGLLYGVTMGGDGVSRLLSVKFEDAKELAAR